MKEFEQTCERMGDAARQAAKAINAFAAAHHDMMNAIVSAHVLKRLGRPNIARWYE